MLLVSARRGLGRFGYFARPLFVALAVGQLAGWGTLYYGFTVFIEPMQQWPGWSREFITAGPSLGLLVWALCAPIIGRILDDYGGRAVMSLGSVLAGTGLLLWGLAPASKWAFLVAWIMIGAAMSAVLYEPAFAILVRSFPSHYKLAIGLLTIAAGFSGTLFIPGIYFVIVQWGWQVAVLGMAALHFLILAPMHTLVVPQGATARRNGRPTQAGNGSLCAHPEFRRRSFIGLAIWFASVSFVMGSMTFLAFPVLLALGAESTVVVTSMAAVGPAQIISRVVSLRWLVGDETPWALGVYAVASLPVAILIIVAFRPTLPSLLLFALVFGSAKGLTTIMKGTFVAEAMGKSLYARCSGWLAMSSIAVKAGTPLLVAAVWSRSGEPASVLWITLAASLIAPIGFFLVHFDQRVRASNLSSTTRRRSSAARRR